MSFDYNCEEVLNQHKSCLSSIIENLHDLEGSGHRLLHIKSVSIVYGTIANLKRGLNKGFNLKLLKYY